MTQIKCTMSYFVIYDTVPPSTAATHLLVLPLILAKGQKPQLLTLVECTQQGNKSVKRCIVEICTHNRREERGSLAEIEIYNNTSN